MDRTAWLQVPEGAYAGDMLTFARGGQEMSIRVPDGFCAGDTFGIQLPNYIYADAGDYDGGDYGGSGCGGSGCGGSDCGGSDCGGSDSGGSDCGGSDSTAMPTEEEDREWQEYMEELAAGGTAGDSLRYQSVYDVTEHRLSASLLDDRGSDSGDLLRALYDGYDEPADTCGDVSVHRGKYKGNQPNMHGVSTFTDGGVYFGQPNGGYRRMSSVQHRFDAANPKHAAVLREANEAEARRIAVPL